MFSVTLFIVAVLIVSPTCVQGGNSAQKKSSSCKELDEIWPPQWFKESVTYRTTHKGLSLEEKARSAAAWAEGVLSKVDKELDYITPLPALKPETISVWPPQWFKDRLKFWSTNLKGLPLEELKADNAALWGEEISRRLSTVDKKLEVEMTVQQNHRTSLVSEGETVIIMAVIGLSGLSVIYAGFSRFRTYVIRDAEAEIAVLTGEERKIKKNEYLRSKRKMQRQKESREKYAKRIDMRAAKTAKKAISKEA